MSISTCYFYSVAMSGNGLSPALTKDVTYYATGYDADDKEIKTITMTFATPEAVTKEWTKWDLSELGEIVPLRLNRLAAPITVTVIRCLRNAVDDITVEWSAAAAVIHSKPISILSYFMKRLYQIVIAVAFLSAACSKGRTPILFPTRRSSRSTARRLTAKAGREIETVRRMSMPRMRRSLGHSTANGSAASPHCGFRPRSPGSILLR